MKTGSKISIISVVILAAMLSLVNIAGACTSAVDREYMVVFHPGITWQEAKNEVASWGNSYELAAITSQKEQQYVMKLLNGLQGEFWIGGYKDTSQKWQWASGETWEYTHWAKGEPDKKFIRDEKEHMQVWKHRRSDKREMNELSSSEFGHYLAMKSGNGRNKWMWYDETNGRNISGFIAERRVANTAPVPIPPAALLLGSGVAMVGGFRMRGRKKRHE
jgi:hypothetical protein